jgi:hypothetical protein
VRVSSRMLKKSASGVLASVRGSTLKRALMIGNTEGAYPFTKIHFKGERPTRSAVRTSSPLRSLQPCWTDLLSILREYSSLAPDVQIIEVQLCRMVFPQHAG